MNVRWSQRARNQVREIFEYIARDRPRAAERILEAFLERTELLAEFPEQGTVFSSTDRPDLRSIIHESHRIVYRIGDGEIAILSVRHTRMRPDEESGTS